jgi:hypothetical protein
VLRREARRRKPPAIGATWFVGPVLGLLLAILLLPTGVVGSSLSPGPARSDLAAPRVATVLPAHRCDPLPSTGCGATPRPLPPPAGAPPVKPQTWTDLTGDVGTPPAARWLAAMVYDPVDRYVVLFGGYGPGGNYGDTWTFANNQWTQLSVAGPGPRYAATMAWDAKDGYAVLFGGYDSANGVYYNDTWTFVHGTWTNITGTTNQTPAARWRASMAYDAADGYVVMFGGTNSAGTAYSDTWKFVGGNWTKLTVTGSPPGRYRASMAFDPAGNDTVLFGGCTSSCPDSTTWTYHNLTWSLRSIATHPSARVYYGFTYSPIAGTLLLFGGSSSGASNVPLSDTWNYTNGTWAQLTTLAHSPPAVAYLMMAFDPVDGYTVMYGGQWANGTYSDQTWALGPSILGELTVAPGAIDLHQNATVNATPFGYSKYVTYSYPTLPPGCAAGNVSTFVCTPNATGNFSVVATLNDSLGVPRTESTSLAVNADPVVASFTVDHPSVTVGSAVNLTPNVTGGTPPYFFQYRGLPSGCGSRDVAPLRCLPGSGSVGPVTVEVEASDAVGYGAFANVSFTVNPRPNVTALLAFPAAIDVGQPLTLRATVVGGTAPISYAYSNLPSGCAPVDAATLNCTPLAAFSGRVELNATDAFGWASEASVLITVAPDPTLTAAAAAPVAFDLGSPVHLWANVSGGTAPFTYRYSNVPVGCTPAPTAATTCTPQIAGEVNLSVEVTDAVGYSVNGTITFTVSPALTLAAVNLSSGAIDLRQNVTISAVPFGGTAPFSYRFKGLPYGCPPTGPANGTLRCAPSKPGISTIDATVTDAAGESVTASGILTVHPDPTVTGFSATPSAVTLGAAVDLLVNVSGGSGVFSYSYSGLPAGCSSENRSPLVCTPSATGSFAVVVTVTDSLGYRTSAETNVTVTAAAASSTILGFSPGAFYGVIAAVVILLLVVAVAALILRRRRNAPAKAPEAWSEDPSGPTR